MNERLFTLLSAAAALVLCAWALGIGPSGEPPKISRPRSDDAGPAGLLGLYRWLESSSVPVRRLRSRYTALAAGPGPDRNNLLVVVEPMALAARPAEGPALRDWVARGNFVLLLRSAAQRVDWGNSSWHSSALHEALGLDQQFLALEGKVSDDGLVCRQAELDEEVLRRQAFCADPALQRGAISGPLRRLRPGSAPAHPLLAGVHEVALKTPFVTRPIYDALGYRDDRRFRYPLLCDPQSRMPVTTAFRLGEGRVWAMDYSEAFTNDNLDRADNARLFANLAAFTLAGRGAVIFDDMHQGGSELYDPAVFFADPRLHGTLAFLLGIWLVWLMGYSNREAPPLAGDRPVTGLRFAQTTARFYARYLRAGETADALFRHFFNRVRARHRLPQTGAPAWDLLERAPGVPPAQLAQLKALYHRLAQRRRVDLVQLRNLTLALQSALS